MRGVFPSNLVRRIMLSGYARYELKSEFSSANDRMTNFSSMLHFIDGVQCERCTDPHCTLHRCIKNLCMDFKHWYSWYSWSQRVKRYWVLHVMVMGYYGKQYDSWMRKALRHRLKSYSESISLYILGRFSLGYRILFQIPAF